MSARRARLRPLRRRRRDHGDDAAVPWGRIGAYEAVTRGGILLLLAPEPAHPSLRAANGP